MKTVEPVAYTPVFPQVVSVELSEAAGCVNNQTASDRPHLYHHRQEQLNEC